MTNLSRRKGKLGVILAITVLVCSFLLILGFSFVVSQEKDTHFQLLSNEQCRAYYLARSGIEYFCFNNFPGRDKSKIPGIPVGSTFKLELNATDSFEVQPLVGGGCVSKGIVRSLNGTTKAERTLSLANTSGADLPVPANLIDLGLK